MLPSAAHAASTYMVPGGSRLSAFSSPASDVETRTRVLEFLTGPE